MAAAEATAGVAEVTEVVAAPVAAAMSSAEVMPDTPDVVGTAVAEDMVAIGAAMEGEEATDMAADTVVGVGAALA